MMTTFQAAVARSLYLAPLISSGAKAEERTTPRALSFGIPLSQSSGDTRYELRAKAADPAGDGLLSARVACRGAVLFEGSQSAYEGLLAIPFATRNRTTSASLIRSNVVG